MGFPAILARAFPGNRLEANRAGMTPSILVGTFDFSMKASVAILKTSLQRRPELPS
jgi:hypothetical protein